MARIELRNTVIRLVDGYTNTGAVNEAGLSGGESTFGVDTLGTSEPVLEQTRFTVVGSTVVYQITDDNAGWVGTVHVGAASGGTWTITVAGVTSGTIAWDASAATVLAALVAMSNISTGDFTVTGTGQSGTPWIISAVNTGDHGNVALTCTGDGSSLTPSDTLSFTITFLGGFTHDITFTPVLDGAIADSAVITFTGRALEINVGDGNITWSEKKEYNYDLNKGNLDAVREGNQVPMDVALNIVYDFLKAPSGELTPQPEEVFKQTGLAANYVSSSSDLCEPYAVDIEIVHTPTCTGVDAETVTIPDFRPESVDHDPREATLNATGRSNATVTTVTRG